MKTKEPTTTEAAKTNEEKKKSNVEQGIRTIPQVASTQFEHS
jgi:hypothetical protein